ncbi:hypothetical protein MNBD_GAMMA23-80 [hydrothermal vent metagenome]|uniref:Adenosylcobinamide-phosphate synthase n=1 Tax=hydrothermal vent metagenome TaxID=652676 RepID=A0A3B0ZX69_9ZZZZ
MEFITILIAVAVEQYYKDVDRYRQFGWFVSYCDWMQQKSTALIPAGSSASGPVRLLILLTPLVVVVAFVDGIFAGMGSFFSFIFSLAILIYSLGPKDLTTQVEKYLASLSSGDTEGALLHANAFFTGHCFEPEISGSPATIAGIMKRGILLAFSNRILAVLFWFIILGPVGALLYRLTILLLERFAGGSFGACPDGDESDSEFKSAIQRLYMILGWVPARLCVITFALAGSFADTLLCWTCASDFFNKNNDELIVASGLHALKMDVEPDNETETDSAADVTGVEQVLALVKWSLIIVITVIALMTIVGWIY